MMKFFIESININIWDANINERYIPNHNINDISIDKLLERKQNIQSTILTNSKATILYIFSLNLDKLFHVL